MHVGYESHYLRAVAPEGGVGFWLRHTVHVEEHQPPLASTWFTLFDATAGHPVASKVTLDASPTSSPEWIEVSGSTLGPGRAAGAIQAAPGRVAVNWDLTFEGEAPLEHLPSPWMYAAPVPRTKPVTIHPSARFSGSVELGERRIDVDEWLGMVGHNWGSEHAERWIWLHGVGFEAEPDSTWIDVVLGRLRAGPATTPWVANGVLSVRGDRRRLGGIAHSRSTRVQERRDGARISLPGRGGLSVAIDATAPEATSVGWVYADPGGGDHAVVNCSIADLELAVRVPGGIVRVIRARGTGAYEIGTRERPAGVPMQPFPDGVDAPRT